VDLFKRSTERLSVGLGCGLAKLAQEFPTMMHIAQRWVATRNDASIPHKDARCRFPTRNDASLPHNLPQGFTLSTHHKDWWIADHRGTHGVRIGEGYWHIHCVKFLWILKGYFHYAHRRNVLNLACNTWTCLTRKEPGVGGGANYSFLEYLRDP